MQRFLLSTSGKYTSRTEILDGRDFIVVPVVALVEGVVHAVNSENAELVTAQEFSENLEDWTDKPIFHGHPMRNGRPILGEYATDERIGIVRAAKVKGSKLTMEAWIDVKLAEARAPRLLERAQNCDPVEISVGVLVDTEPTQGTYGGKTYRGAWSNMRPDHLALLPEDQEGACSREMGCGIRAAMKGDSTVEVNMYDAWLEQNEETKELLKTLRNIPQSVRDEMPAADFAGPDRSFPIEKPADVAAAASSLGRAKGNRDAIKRKIIAIAYRKGESYVAKLPEDWKRKKDQKNASALARIMSAAASLFRAAQPADEMSSNDLTSKLSEKLREVEPSFNGVYCFHPVTEPNRVVYSTYEPGVAPDWLGVVTLWERGFALAENGAVTVNADAVEVQPVTYYEPVLMEEERSPQVLVGKRNSAKDQSAIQAMHDHAVYLGAGCSSGQKNMAAGVSCSCQHQEEPTTIQTGEETMKSEDVAAFLKSATPEVLKSLGVAKIAEGAAAAAETPATTAVQQPAAAGTTQVTEQKQEPTVAAAKTPTFEEVLAQADPDTRESIEEGKRMATAKKAETIKVLKATGRCQYSDEELGKMKQVELDRLVVLAGPAKQTNTPRAAVDFGGQGASRVDTPTEAPKAPDLQERLRAARGQKK